MDRDVTEPGERGEWVKLVSRNGFSFIVRREVVMASGMLKNMLDSDFSESLTGIIRIDQSGIVVEKLIEYLMYKKLYEHVAPKDRPDFQERIIPEIALELLVAADFYDT
ncbi:POZ domain-containing [Pyrrhoderma noxium]|uniref:Elongin-C n=1 Tax=Pyrrhoderma noxium TaxID=2282107 RepID=A0A286UE16_9AGAM|nr:POZ domain-containing [Pyrrhoderma noxium]